MEVGYQRRAPAVLTMDVNEKTWIGFSWTSEHGNEPWGLNEMQLVYQLNHCQLRKDNFYICTVHSRYEDFFIKIQLMHSL